MKLAISIALLLLPAAAMAQSSPYAGQQGREIKSLSPEEVGQYLSGAGMGYAKAAELNGYPGPMHVIELSGELALTSEQRDAVERLMVLHKAEARAIGANLVDAERELERLFATAHANQAALAMQVKKVAELEGEYRLSHLETHRRTRSMLTSVQLERYNQLRGYDTGHQTDKHHGAPHHEEGTAAVK